MTTKAMKAEADDAPVTVEHNGFTYTVPPTGDWPADALLYLDSNTAKTLYAILGPQQWAAAQSAGVLPIKQLGPTLDAILKARGLGAGESSGSTDS